MTQAQWLRFTGANPSGRPPTALYRGKPVTLLHPVEQVSWEDCSRTLARLGFALPTEAQWEYAARAGTDTIWFTGDERQTLAGFVNLADAFLRSAEGPGSWSYETWLDDGYPSTAPVGTYNANAFGLHDLSGNVWEWCRDRLERFTEPVRAGDGERSAREDFRRILRGGGWGDSALNARSVVREAFDSGRSDDALGLRPARALTPSSARRRP
jgi:formylglycine-generating enzyme required for sulfatase activity